MHLVPVAFGVPSGGDLLIIAILVLVLFGAKKLPLFARSLGRSMGEFRKTKGEFEEEMRNATKLNQRSHHDDPDAMVDMVLYWLFGLSLLFYIVSMSSKFVN